MAVSTQPFFRQSILSETVTVSTANSNRDGSTGTYSSAVTAGSNGSEVDAIVIKASGSTTAGLVRIFYAADGSTYRLIDEVAVSAVTPSGTTASEVQVWIPYSGLPFPMKGNSALKFNTHNAESFNIHVLGGSF